MSYTELQAITKVRQLINESTPAFWTDTELQGWIQDGTLDVSAKLGSYAALETITLVTDRFRYTSTQHSWLGTCLKPKAVWYEGTATDPIALQAIDPIQIGHTTRTDQPPIYYFFDSFMRMMYLLPTPTATTNGDSVTVLHAAETNDITNLKDSHQPFVFLYAAAMAKAKERLHSESANFMQLYLTSIEFERQDKTTMGVDPTSSIEIPYAVKQQ